MTKASHTAGEWKACSLVDFGICNVTSRTRPVAFTGTKYGKEEDEANARLIAAAPAMYSLIADMAEHGECFCADYVASKGPCDWCKAKEVLAMIISNEKESP